MAEALASQDDCMICFERPQLYGLLHNCNHQFCLECIKTWRKSDSLRAQDPTAGSGFAAFRADWSLAMPALREGALQLGIPMPHDQEPSEQHTLTSEERSRNTQGCPLCRQPSRHVYPSTTLPTTPEAKEKIIKGYRQEKKRMLCRHFEASIGTIQGYYCPAFNDCLYAHLKPLDAPDSQIRNEPFVFTEERIRQLRLRKAIRGPDTDLGRFFNSPNVPTHVYQAATELLAIAQQTFSDFEDDMYPEELLKEFCASYTEHANVYRVWLNRHLVSNDIATASDEPRSFDVYHLYNEDGEYMHYALYHDGSPHSDYPTFFEFADVLEQQNARLGTIKHHFLSPLEALDATDIIKNEPNFFALKASIAAREPLDTDAEARGPCLMDPFADYLGTGRATFDADMDLFWDEEHDYNYPDEDALELALDNSDRAAYLRMIDAMTGVRHAEDDGDDPTNADFDNTNDLHEHELDWEDEPDDPVDVDDPNDNDHDGSEPHEHEDYQEQGEEEEEEEEEHNHDDGSRPGAMMSFADYLDTFGHDAGHDMEDVHAEFYVDEEDEMDMGQYEFQYRGR